MTAGERPGGLAGGASGDAPAARMHRLRLTARNANSQKESCHG